MACENEQLQIKWKDSCSLIKCYDLFERYRGLAVSYRHELSQKSKNYFDEDIFLLIKKKLLDDFCLKYCPLEFFIVFFTVTEVSTCMINEFSLPDFMSEKDIFLII